MPTPRRADVVMVGLGCSGSIMAHELAQAGLRVVGLERGPSYTLEEFGDAHDELRNSIRMAMSPTLDKQPLTWRPDARTPARLLPWVTATLSNRASAPWATIPLAGNPLFMPPSLGVGGGTIHWACWSWRFLPDEFRMRSAVVEHLGEQALPPGSTIVDWPISYDDLEPYYDRVEYVMGVSGKAGNIKGALQDGGNPFEGPRSREFPLPPLRPSPASPRFAAATRELGLHPFPAPAQILSQEYDGRKACVYCGHCRDYGCHVGAKGSDFLVHRALATGNLTIQTDAVAYRVEKHNGRATAVLYHDGAGNEQRVEGAIIILGTYALENARLLLLSDINGNGMVGKYYMTHNYGWMNALIDDERTNIFAGPAVGGHAVDDYNGFDLDRGPYSFLQGSPIMFFGGDIQAIEGVSNIPPGVPTWGQGYKDWIRQNFSHVIGLYSQTSSLPSAESFVDLDPQVRDPFGLPALRITHRWTDHETAAVRWLNEKKTALFTAMGARTIWNAPVAPPYNVSTHEVGITRMGGDPATSVANKYGQSHELPNLFILGGGLFPTYGGYNPTETIQALTYMSADYVKKEVQGGGSLAR
jgi:gluconate 2-dehydrogenase alpha chain